MIAIAFGTINVVGGFLVTDRMLGMFKGQKPDPARRRSDAGVSRLDWVNLLYIVGFALFIVGLRMVRGPRTAVRGNLIAAVGMAIALVATLIDPRIGDWVLIVVGVVIGTAIGIPAARSVKMTAMPQMVALFNGVGGGAVALISLVEFREERRHRARGADPDRARGDHRLDLVLGLERRVLQAAGAAPGPSAASRCASSRSLNLGARRGRRSRSR